MDEKLIKESEQFHIFMNNLEKEKFDLKSENAKLKSLLEKASYLLGPKYCMCIEGSDYKDYICDGCRVAAEIKAALGDGK